MGVSQMKRAISQKTAEAAHCEVPQFRCSGKGMVLEARNQLFYLLPP